MGFGDCCKIFLCLVSVASFCPSTLAQGNAQLLACTTNCEKDVTAEGDPIVVACVLPYSGGSIPVLTWHNKKDRSLVPGVPPQEQDGNRHIIARGFTMKAVAPGKFPYICLARAPNVSDRQCEPESCSILYSARNVVTWPLLYASPGETITCKADGNPEPSYEWQWLKEDGEGKWMDVPDAKSNKIDTFLNNGTSIQLRCVAKNNVRGEDHIKNSAAVIISKHGTAIRWAIIGAVAAVLVLLAIIWAVIYKKCPEILPDQLKPCDK